MPQDVDGAATAAQPDLPPAAVAVQVDGREVELPDVAVAPVGAVAARLDVPDVEGGPVPGLGASAEGADVAGAVGGGGHGHRSFRLTRAVSRRRAAATLMPS